MVSVCTVPARGGRSCEHFGGYKTINRIPLWGTVLTSIINKNHFLNIHTPQQFLPNIKGLCGCVFLKRQVLYNPNVIATVLCFKESHKLFKTQSLKMSNYIR